MKFGDYCDGTAYILLLREDFKSEDRYKSYARFMGQSVDSGAVEIPIDSERARRLSLALSKRIQVEE